MKKISNHFRENYGSFLLYRRFFQNPLNLIAPFFRFTADRYLNINNNFPLNINLRVTERCNNKCLMCLEKKYLNRKNDELTYEEIVSFISKIAPYNPLLFITGGEPFCRKDIMKILQIIKKKGVHCGICTNGTILDKKKIKTLAKLDIDNIIFSLHGNEHSHDSITNVAGSYKNAINNIRLFCRQKINTHVMVNCTILPQNIDDLTQLINNCQNLGVDSVRFQHLSFSRKSEVEKQNKLFRDEFNREVGLHNNMIDEDTEHLAEKIKEIKKKKFKIPVIFNPYLTDREIDEWYGKKYIFRRKCSILWFSVVVDSVGNVMPCQTYDLSLGNIKDKDLKVIYNSNQALRFRHRIKNKMMPACARCCKL